MTAGAVGGRCLGATYDWATGERFGPDGYPCENEMSVMHPASADSRTGAGKVPSPGPAASDPFWRRHIGPDEAQIREMLDVVGAESLDALTDEAIGADIRLDRLLDLPAALSEHEMLARLRAIASRNRVMRSCIGMGYSETVTPGVILRNILENPGWYTQYTPYQAEISQGRLEALLNFQTMVSDLTGLEVANASLLDEASAAVEAMVMCVNITKRSRFFVAKDCHPQTINVCRTRAEAIGVEIVVGEATEEQIVGGDFAGVLVQYPTTDGRIACYEGLSAAAHEDGAMVVCACDLLALTLLRPPGEWGADVAVGSAQRFGVPMGLGGPHAAFLASSMRHVRRMPGRIIGVSRDAHGRPALRMSIQTREQHIKRERATSNICTAQALLAIMAGMYGVYHGPDGLRRIAGRIRGFARALAFGLSRLGHEVCERDLFFDTIRVRPGASAGGAEAVLTRAHDLGINLRDFGDGSLGISLGETADDALVRDLLRAFGSSGEEDIDELREGFAQVAYPEAFARSTSFMTHPVFREHHSETKMLRYITRLQSRDLSLAHSMIPLGSCTMKLNATSEMIPITWPELCDLHPYAPRDQWEGYRELFEELGAWLGEITGLPAVSLQPNAGSQGEYAGLLAIRGYHKARGDQGRTVCLIPTSAHGTNPASAIAAGFRVVAVRCDERGNIDLDDLRARAQEHAQTLGALMITYPSTHGVFERTIREICEIVHESGGLVYLDGANMNAMVGLARPGDFGADVCHLNLHKTFCIPHGGGGPGMGPICATEALRAYLPGDPLEGRGAVTAAPFGSAAILPISWAYIRMMGSDGLRRASQVAILNANYMARRLEDHYPILYRGPGGRVAHEFILDCRAFEKTAGIRIDDIAKRLMDFGFHAPTMAWPVPGTLMIEPTESEDRGELDRYCDALIAIREEIAQIERGESDREDNPLKHAPHTIEEVSRDDWTHAYPRSQAAYPAPWLREGKFWAPVGRVDNPYGDRNLVCTCPSVEELGES